MGFTERQTIDYYDGSERAYRDAWFLDKSKALHYGFWGRGVFSLPAALKNENRILAEMAGITSADYVLDAGCGVGGSSLYLASHIGCRTMGISLSRKQVETARQYARSAGLDALCSFRESDYQNTGFPDSAYSVVWFVESFGYSPDRNVLLKEAYRLLQPGGRLLIADGFSTKQTMTASEQTIMNRWLNNWAIDSIAMVSEVEKEMRHAGFRNVKIVDYTRAMWPSAMYMYLCAVLAVAWGKLRGWMGRPYVSQEGVKNTTGARYQFVALRRKLWSYKVIVAEK